jgi:glutathione peroxidase
MLIHLLTTLTLALAASAPTSFYELSAKDIDGKDVPMKSFAGKVALVVNTASECGFTYQYGGLQKIFEENKNQGFVVLGFPSNDFGSQEPGNEGQIKLFCKSNYKVTFPMFSKSIVKGDQKSPIYQFLTTSGPTDTHGEVTWNFNKFLVNKMGKVVARFSSNDKPDSSKIQAAIQAALDEK